MVIIALVVSGALVCVFYARWKDKNREKQDKMEFSYHEENGIYEVDYIGGTPVSAEDVNDSFTLWRSKPITKKG